MSEQDAFTRLALSSKSDNYELVRGLLVALTERMLEQQCIPKQRRDSHSEILPLQEKTDISNHPTFCHILTRESSALTRQSPLHTSRSTPSPSPYMPPLATSSSNIHHEQSVNFRDSGMSSRDSGISSRDSCMLSRDSSVIAQRGHSEFSVVGTNSYSGKISSRNSFDGLKDQFLFAISSHV